MIQNENLRRSSVTFTGHRFIPYDKREQLTAALKAAIIEQYRKGFTNFFNGVAVGFDMLAAEVVLSLKKQYKDITLTAAVPFREQSAKFSFTDKRRYQYIISKADRVIILSERYYEGCFLRRNDFMLSNSIEVIAYYDGQPKGGTYYTCQKAALAGLSIINLYTNSNNQSLTQHILQL